MSSIKCAASWAHKDKDTAPASCAHLSRSSCSTRLRSWFTLVAAATWASAVQCTCMGMVCCIERTALGKHGVLPRGGQAWWTHLAKERNDLIHYTTDCIRIHTDNGRATAGGGLGWRQQEGCRCAVTDECCTASSYAVVIIYDGTEHDQSVILAIFGV